ncbi:hypothetical protein [Cellulomonas endophytica]|uniref:hypothetical protein n=1 Tax=Cellulomonas endophytica TaxID=2494735 RepID=UPI0013E96E70|nr:hypothetical protein [Cellulomonas endophytica]
MRITGEHALSVTFSSITIDPEPVAVDTGAPVVVAPESGSCRADEGGISYSGDIGDACVLRVTAPGDAGHRPFDARIHIAFRASQHLSWQVAQEPRSPGCYAPGTTVEGALVLVATGTTSDLWALDVLDDGAGLSAERDYDSAREVRVTIRVDQDAEAGLHVVRVGYLSQGQTLTSADRPTVRDYRVSDPGTDPTCASSS